MRRFGREIVDCLACVGALPGDDHPEIYAALLRFITVDHARQMLGLSMPARSSSRRRCSACCPSPAKFHLRFPEPCLQKHEGHGHRAHGVLTLERLLLWGQLKVAGCFSGEGRQA